MSTRTLRNLVRTIAGKTSEGRTLAGSEVAGVAYAVAASLAGLRRLPEDMQLAIARSEAERYIAQWLGL